MSGDIDFLSGKNQYRRKQGGGFGQLILKACGIKPHRQITLIDATAGLGQDAFVFACAGCRVILLERNPIVAEKLATGLQRLFENQPDFREKMQLIPQDAIVYLTQLSPENYPAVIYLDPMFPEKRKNALPQKNMRWLRDIAGDDPDASPLFDIACQRATERVVVKRPRLAPFIRENRKPSFQYIGKSCRFDVYLV